MLLMLFLLLLLMKLLSLSMLLMLLLLLSMLLVLLLFYYAVSFACRKEQSILHNLFHLVEIYITKTFNEEIKIRNRKNENI